MNKFTEKSFFDDSCTSKYFLSSGTYTPKHKVTQRILFVVYFENFGRPNNTSNGSVLIQILWSNEYLKIHFGVNASYYCIFFVKWTITSFYFSGGWISISTVLNTSYSNCIKWEYISLPSFLLLINIDNEIFFWISFSI